MPDTTQTQQHIHFGHLGLILSVAVLLLGISWMKNPQLFNVFKTQGDNSQISANLPKYYAYQSPPELNQSFVAGANTANQGPMIINEDGTLSPAIETGDILGINTENVNLDINSITINTIPDADENIKAYIAGALLIEGDYLDGAQFEGALSSGNQAQIDTQARVVDSIVAKLLSLSVPVSLGELHKLKIVQYRAASEILKNFTKADDNPELINQKLDLFIKAEKLIQEEYLSLKNKFGMVIGI